MVLHHILQWVSQLVVVQKLKANKKKKNHLKKKLLATQLILWAQNLLLMEKVRVGFNRHLMMLCLYLIN